VVPRPCPSSASLRLLPGHPRPARTKGPRIGSLRDSPGYGPPAPRIGSLHVSPVWPAAPRIGSLRDSRSLASRAAYRVVARIPSLAPRPGHCPLQPTRSRNRRLPRRLRRRLGPRGQPSGLPPAQRHRRHAHDHPATHTKPSQCRTRPPPQPRRQTVAWGQWRQRLKRHLGRMLRRPQLLRRRDHCAAIPAGKYPGNSAAAHASPIPTISVGTQRCANRFGAPLSVNRPCAVFAATIRARLSGVRGPVPAPQCLRRRPFAIASPRHRLPARVRALQTGGPPPRTRATPACKPPRLA
jgi:hypothetical protein